MSLKFIDLLKSSSTKKAAITLISVVFFFGVGVDSVFAQRKFSKSYPATKNIRLELTNRTGTIIVRGWNKKKVKISARLEKPIAKIVPQNLSGTIRINVIEDNKGRREVGTVNFIVDVPFDSKVDIETRIGNLEVSDIRGGYVRAHISSEGDITLTNIGAANVSAKNVIGDIFYDGLLRPLGIYRFISTKGNINIRIPVKASFTLVATAPSTRNISLGVFKNVNMNYVGNGRRVVGKAGTGSATMTVTNQLGTISFLRR